MADLLSEVIDHLLPENRFRCSQFDRIMRKACLVVDLGITTNIEQGNLLALSRNRAINLHQHKGYAKRACRRGSIELVEFLITHLCPPGHLFRYSCRYRSIPIYRYLETRFPVSICDAIRGIYEGIEMRHDPLLSEITQFAQKIADQEGAEFEYQIACQRLIGSASNGNLELFIDAYRSWIQSEFALFGIFPIAEAFFQAAKGHHNKIIDFLISKGYQPPS